METSFSVPSLKDVPGVSGTVLARAASTLHQQETSADAAEAHFSKKPAHFTSSLAAFPFTAPSLSSSNGETLLLLHPSHTADTTATADPHDAQRDASQTPRFVDDTSMATTAIELSPSSSIHHSDREEAEVEIASPVPPSSMNLVEEEGEEEGHDAGNTFCMDTNDTTQRVQDVWTRQVRVGASSRDDGIREEKGTSVLSAAASRVIAHALHRATLLRRCFDQWQAQQERQHQRRQHQQRFAQDYFERNLRYLLFRAWQWRYTQRHRITEVTRQAEELRNQQLCRRTLRLWRAWRLKQQCDRSSVQQLLLTQRATLRSVYFAKWLLHCRRKARAVALGTVQVEATRRHFLARWRRAAVVRQRRLLLANVVSLHTPAAWGDAKEAGAVTHVLLLRCSWIQWLRVTMQKRAFRLQRRAACTAVVSAATVEAHRRRCFTQWLRVTLASLECRQLQRAVQRCSFHGWERMGRLSHAAKRWSAEVQKPRVVLRCLQLWRDRCNMRERRQVLDRQAMLFATSVMRVHCVEAAFQRWRRRWSGRERRRRMHRVAQEYARPALLRFLFARHVTDGVLGSFTGQVDDGGGEESADRSSWKGTSSQLQPVPCRQDEGDMQKRTTAELLSSPPVPRLPAMRSALKPPIPLRLSFSHHNNESSQRNTGVVERETECGAAEAAQQALPTRCRPSGPVLSPPPTGSLESPVEVMTPVQEPPSATALCATSLSPPPPTYEEVMRQLRAAAAPPPAATAVATEIMEATRCDVGVSTEMEPCVMHIAGESQESHAALGSTAREPSGPAFLTAPPSPAAAVPPSSAMVRHLSSSPAAAEMTVPFYPLYGVPYNSLPPQWLPPPYSTLLWPPFYPTGAAAAVPEDAAPLRIDKTTTTPTAASAEYTHRVEQPRQDVAADASAPSRCPSCARDARPLLVSPSFCASSPTHAAAPSTELAETVAVAQSKTSLLQPTHHVDSGNGAPTAAVHAESVEISEQHEGGRERGKREHQTKRWEGELRCSATTTRDVPDAVHDARRPLMTPDPHVPHQSTCVPAPLATGVSASSSFSSRSPSPSLFTLNAALPSPPPPLPLLSPPQQPIDSTALRLTARTVLDDYRHRTRRLAAEKAELTTIAARLALENQLGLSTSERQAALRVRQRYLQRRVLAWQQRRAQVAQLTAVLEAQVSARASRAVSRAGRDEEEN